MLTEDLAVKVAANNIATKFFQLQPVYIPIYSGCSWKSFVAMGNRMQRPSVHHWRGFSLFTQHI